MWGGFEGSGELSLPGWVRVAEQGILGSED